MRTSSLLLPLVALLGCTHAEPPPGYIAPLDGQTSIPTDMDLVVFTSTLELPPEWPAPGLVRVVDLETGGHVSGALSYDGAALRFRPDQPWQPDRRYAWTVDPEPDIPHAPEVRVEPHLVGTAVFDTSSALDLLAAAVPSDDEICLVFSRPLVDADDARIRVTVDDVDLRDFTFEALPQHLWGVDPVLDPRDPGVGVACLHTATRVAPGGALRLWWGDAGPWRVELQDALLPDVFDTLRRGAVR